MPHYYPISQLLTRAKSNDLFITNVVFEPQSAVASVLTLSPDCKCNRTSLADGKSLIISFHRVSLCMYAYVISLNIGWPRI